MSVVMLELTWRPADAAPVESVVADDAVLLVDDVEELGAYARCNCAASDDNPY